MQNIATASKVLLSASQIYTDTFFNYVGADEIVFIKRNEQRFWTDSAAYEDVESSLTHLMNIPVSRQS